MIRRRTAVYVALSNTVGHELVFRHYTNKVVVGKHPGMKKIKSPEQAQKRKRNSDQ